MRSPTILLASPSDVRLPSSDGIVYFHMGMTEDGRDGVTLKFWWEPDKKKKNKIRYIIFFNT